MAEVYTNYQELHARLQTFRTWTLQSPNNHDMADAGFIFKGDNILKCEVFIYSPEPWYSLDGGHFFACVCVHVCFYVLKEHIKYAHLSQLYYRPAIIHVVTRFYLFKFFYWTLAIPVIQHHVTCHTWRLLRKLINPPHQGATIAST